MATFEFDKRKVYYEIYGKGKPILFLNGLMMSTISWKAIYKALSNNNQIILVDFLDQGRSELLENFIYKQDIQVELVLNLINYLNIEKVNIVGISYGGEIALQFAIKYSDKIDKLLLFNTASNSTPWMNNIKNGWLDILKSDISSIFYNLSVPFMYSYDYFHKNIEMIKKHEQIFKQTYNKNLIDALIRMLNSAEGYDVRNKLSNINIPTLIVGCENDILIPIEEQVYLNKQIKSSKLFIIENCGHASVFERPDEIVKIIKDFVK